MSKKATRVLVATFCAVFFVASASAQTTTFTYQGSLNDGANAANGNYDFEFGLFDVAGGGTQLGSTVAANVVAVVKGVFSVPLNFGNQFPGSGRFLEIRVRLSGAGAFTTLTPRQPIDSAPYSVKSLNADNATNAVNATIATTATNATTANNALNLGGVAAGQHVLTGDARLVDARTPTAGSANYVQNTAVQQAASNFNISGNGTAGGTLSGGIVNATTQYNIGGSRVLSVAGSDNLFAGVGAGAANTGFQNSFFGMNAGASNTTGVANSFVGSFAGQANTTGNSNSFVGSGAGFSNTTGVSNSFVGVFAGSENRTGSDNSFVGTSAGAGNTSGINNSFFGRRAGASNTIGVSNTFLGESAGQSNITGSNNSALGVGANVGSGNLTFASAIGAGAVVSTSSTVVLGRGADTVQVPGSLNVTGNVGIGTATPAARLQVNGSSGSVTSPVAIVESSGSQVPLAFRIAGSEVARVRADGLGNLVLATLQGAERNIHFRAGDDSAGANMFIQSATGNVGIRTLSPDDTLHVNGIIRVATLGVAGPTTICRNASNQISTCSSSLRYKTNINPFGFGLDLVRRLRPITFEWKDSRMHDLGLGAEDVAAIEPLLVTYNDKGEVEGVKYDRIGVVLINAIKEQQAQIEILRAFVCELKPDAKACSPK